MHIMSRFTLTHLKGNKRHAFFTGFAIFIATLFISTLVFGAYSYQQSNITLAIENSGEWHGAFSIDIPGEKVPYINEHPEVEKTFIKSHFYTLKPQGSEGRPFFAHVDLNKNYRNEMGWGDMAVAGRLPESENEIILSEDFFKDNPQYQIGSTITVDEGKRIAQGEVVDARDAIRDGEVFEGIGEKTYTIVGVLDASYEYSDKPIYLSFGYSDEIRTDQSYIVNIQFKNIWDTYQLMPQLAETIGMTTDGEGKYPVRYHTYLLGSYGVFEDGISNQFLNMMMVYIVIALLIMAFFVTIIYHTFAVSANSRVKNLGLLKSIGATPKQIRHSVLVEGILLSSLGIPLGMFGGYGIIRIMFNQLNKIYDTLETGAQLGVYGSVSCLLIITLMTLVVVLISAYLPARKVAKLSPIVAIKQGDYQVKKMTETAFTRWIGKMLGYEGTLAMKSNQAHRKGFRAAYISLTLSFTIILIAMLYMNIWQVAVSYDPRPPQYEMKVYLNDVGQEEFERLDREVRAIEQVEHVQRNKGTVYGYTKVATEDLGKALKTKGLEYMEESVTQVDGQYDFVTEIFTLDDESFNAYSKGIGANPEEFYGDDGVKAILYNSTIYNNREIIQEQESIPLFTWEKGDRITVREDLGREDKLKEPYVFDVELGYVTNQIIPHGQYYDYYRVILIIPESMSQKLLVNFSENNRLRYNRDISYLDVAEEDIPVVKAQIEQIYQKHKEKTNFRLWDSISAKEGQEQMIGVMMVGATMGISFITLVGLVNIYSTVSSQINMRRKEFAMLKSVGISATGIKKILLLESVFYSVKPIVYSVPLTIGMGLFLLNVNRLKWTNIFDVLPYGVFVVGGVVLAGVIFTLSYLLSRAIMKETIIDVIKDEIQ